MSIFSRDKKSVLGESTIKKIKAAKKNGIDRGKAWVDIAPNMPRSAFDVIWYDKGGKK